MFENIGAKIKTLATVIFWVEFISFLILSLIKMSGGGGIGVVIGLLLLILSPIVAWFSSFLLYGFGELIDKTKDVERNTRASADKMCELVCYLNGDASAEDAKRENAGMGKMEKLRELGVITEEEYQAAINKRQGNMFS